VSGCISLPREHRENRIQEKMMRTIQFMTVALLALPALALGATDSEIAALREELKQVRETYEARLKALEQRLEQAEAKAAQPVAAPALPTTQPGPTAESAFNPAISLILQGTYANLSENPDTFQIGGFIPSGGEIGPGERGFSLKETELFLSANVDPFFRGAATVALTPEDEVEVEEAFFQTLGLGRGFTLKAGRFFSGIGYLNEIHQHAFDFVDFPLVYQAFFGRNFADEGVQLKWLAPTPLFLEFGAEFGRGRNFPASDRNKNGIGSGTGFFHLGGDIGASHAWRVGASYIRTSPKDREFESVDSMGLPATDAFSGESKTWGLDFVWKYAPQGNATVTNFKLQGEYFWRKEDGSLSFDDSAGADLFGLISDRYSSRQWGWYLEGVYQFAPRWRMGLRHDRLNSGDVDIGLVQNGPLTGADFPLLASHDPERKTIMLDFSPSEFSRFRLQYARDESRFQGTDHEWFLQYIMSLGPHGAHRF
jgi:hypothetical protein